MSLSMQQTKELSLNQLALECGVDSNVYLSLRDSLYPGAKHESLCLVMAYCRARKIDPMLKPVHIVPMYVKTNQKDRNGKNIYEYRDVIMPGIGSYRIDAARSGQYAGMSEPEYGEDITEVVGEKKITYPRWCKITVYKKLDDRIIEFSAKEFWKENYATQGRSTPTPNEIWAKRPYGQLAKCTEAQALRKAFPDVVGQENTSDEMLGKTFIQDDTNDTKQEKTANASLYINNIKSDNHEVSFSEEEKKENLDHIIDVIDMCENMDHLNKTFLQFTRDKYIRENKQYLNSIIEAKDKKKIELQEKAKEEFLREYDAETGEVKEEEIQ